MIQHPAIQRKHDKTHLGDPCICRYFPGKPHLGDLKPQKSCRDCISEDYLALGFMLFPNCKLQLQVMSAGLSRVERLLMQKDAIHDEVKNDELSSGKLGSEVRK